MTLEEFKRRMAPVCKEGQIGYADHKKWPEKFVFAKIQWGGFYIVTYVNLEGCPDLLAWAAASTIEEMLKFVGETDAFADNLREALENWR